MPNITINKEFVKILSEHDKIPIAYPLYLDKLVYRTGRNSSKKANGIFLDGDGDGQIIIFCKDGLLHREDGPAILSLSSVVTDDYPSQGCEWFINGIRIEELDGKSYCDERKLSLLILKYSNI